MSGTEPIPPPLSALFELTHRCPLSCPYCSNPLELAKRSDEMGTPDWLGVIDQAADMGVLQSHFSGGEPVLRRDLHEFIARAAGRGMYTNLITSGVAGDAAIVNRLADAGLDHVQLSFQDSYASSADAIGHFRNGFERKLRFAGWVRERGLPLTVNAVLHRHNAERVPEMIELAIRLGASRIEVAHTQYYGWGLLNRAALMPSQDQLESATRAVLQARERLQGRLVVDYVTPDYYASRPKACMGGWGQRAINITPKGDVLLCHAAETIPGLIFDNVRYRRLDEIWRQSEAFAAYRGTAWMPQPCQGCPKQEIDWGGCRCQALALSGRADVLDPVCERSGDHERIRAIAVAESTSPPPFIFRRLIANSAN